MDNNDQNQDRKKGLVDFGNSLASSFKNVQQLTRFIPTSMPTPTGITGMVSRFGPFGWGGVAVLILAILGIIVIFFFSDGGGGIIPQLGGSTNPAPTQSGGPAPICKNTGSLDYSIPFRDTTLLPQAKEQFLAQHPGAQGQNWDTIVNQSVANGWNPSFILTLWIEESGGQSGTSYVDGNPNGYKDALGCDPTHPTNDINTSLNCVFTSFKDPTLTFEDLMCIYGGDDFHRAPCTFVEPPPKGNPNFPGNIKKVYSEISSGGTAQTSGDVALCTPPTTGEPLAQGSWPTSGLLTQGPLGAFDHADLKSRTGWDSIDVASPYGGGLPQIFSSFDGAVAEAHSCVSDNTCSVHYGNYVIINNGGFSTMYGHLSQISVAQGQTIKAGEPIGVMGTTGNSTGVHLHWEFRGAEMAPPNIPSAISPLNCDTPSIPCSPAQISPNGGGSGV